MLRTTDKDFVNRNGQKVIRKTDLPGTDHNQKVYVLKCQGKDCGLTYGANGSDIFERKCPNCQGGKKGIEI